MLEVQFKTKLRMTSSLFFQWVLPFFFFFFFLAVQFKIVVVDYRLGHFVSPSFLLCWPSDAHPHSKEDNGSKHVTAVWIRLEHFVCSSFAVLLEFCFSGLQVRAIDVLGANPECPDSEVC